MQSSQLRHALIGCLTVAVLQANGPVAAATAVKPGQIAPGFSARDIRGKQVRLASLRGKVILLDFWMTT